MTRLLLNAILIHVSSITVNFILTQHTCFVVVLGKRCFLLHNQPAIKRKTYLKQIVIKTMQIDNKITKMKEIRPLSLLFKHILKYIRL